MVKTTVIMSVPNVPCGVENSSLKVKMTFGTPFVPNVPCGVESGRGITNSINFKIVPNVPCGVESALVCKMRERT